MSTPLLSIVAETELLENSEEGKTHNNRQV